MLGSSLLSLDDSQLIRNMFVNYRITSDSTRGLRIHGEAELLLSYYFSSYKIELPQPYVEKPSHTIFLDRVTTMPWYLTSQEIVLYERELALRLKMVGDIETLMNGFDDYSSFRVTE